MMFGFTLEEECYNMGTRNDKTLGFSISSEVTMETCKFIVVALKYIVTLPLRLLSQA